MSGSGDAFSGDACEGGTQFVDNFLDIGTTKGGAAASMYADVASSGNSGIELMRPGDLSSPSLLPDCQLSAPDNLTSCLPDSSSTLLSPSNLTIDASPSLGGIGDGALSGGQGLQGLQGLMDGAVNGAQGFGGLMDSALGTGDPMGLLGKVFEFILSLFGGMGEQLAHVLPSVDLYGQATEAALDVAKGRIGTSL